jgi:hypothetical protein
MKKEEVEKMIIQDIELMKDKIEKDSLEKEIEIEKEDYKHSKIKLKRTNVNCYYANILTKNKDLNLIWHYSTINEEIIIYLESSCSYVFYKRPPLKEKQNNSDKTNNIKKNLFELLEDLKSYRKYYQYLADPAHDFGCIIKKVETLISEFKEQERD